MFPGANFPVIIPKEEGCNGQGLWLMMNEFNSPISQLIGEDVQTILTLADRFRLP